MSENLTQTEQKNTENVGEAQEAELTLREELVKQLNEVTEDDDTQGKEATEERSRKERPQSERSQDEEHGEDKEKDEEAETKLLEEEVVEEKVEEKAEETETPNNWNAEEKKAFEDIPDEILTQDGTTISLKAMKDVALNRYEELLKGFNEKAREASTAKKGSEEWNKLLDPYKPQLTAAGMEPQQWIGTILQGVHNLQQNPAAVIKDLIGTYKVSAADLGIKAEQSEDEDDFHGESDPKVTKLETTIETLQKRLDSFENATIQRSNQTVQDEIVAFKSQTNADGNLTHPHFDEARDEMGILMSTGKAKTMQEAYDKCPAVMSKGLKVVKTDNKESLKKAREEAAKAKKAGKTVKTRSGQSVNPHKGLSLRDELKAGLRA